MSIKKHDFIEMEFTAKFKDGTVFDTTDKKIAQDNNIFNSKVDYKPAIIAVGEQQVPKGLDQDLEGKETNKEYTVEMQPEDAFGKKDGKKIKLVPLMAFKKQEIMPQPGLQVNIDNELGTILRVSGGRVLVDFNHPFSSKEVVYTYKVKRILTDAQEKIEAFMNMSLNLPGISAEVKDNKAVITLPLELPEPAQEPIKKKIIELTQVKEVTFKKLEPKPKKEQKPEVKKEEKQPTPSEPKPSTQD